MEKVVTGKSTRFVIQRCCSWLSLGWEKYLCGKVLKCTELQTNNNVALLYYTDANYNKMLFKVSLAF